ncbi:YciI family protein [Psychroflexus sp. CAK8W]|uniref:YciI family protein n=1 Tax=Psychroflexus longus TaxID=2873596 RepID=A0ABS7XIX2_9FLAO|nr:YciI-like protein [Psychroflexus longus]MBZ9778918.1 YciI family protein [Psychroflexus longus]
MHYILFYKAVENYIEKRAPYREEHLKLIESFYSQGDLLMAGALDDPATGGAFIFKGDSTEKAEEFANKDPYVKNGLITEWEVRPWTVVIGS